MPSSKNKMLKRPREPTNHFRDDNLPELALAAICSSRRQNEVSEFINFLLLGLERNSDWLNGILSKQSNFKCALMLGAGPNRFQVQEIIYPSQNHNIKLEVELKDSEDFDKIAVAALFKLTNADMQKIMEYIKVSIYGNITLKEDMLRGKAMGVQFALLRPFSNTQYRVAERIVVGSSMKCLLPAHMRTDYLKHAPTKKAKREHTA